jgi:hypothetical protein
MDHDLTTILQNLGATDISGASSYVYNSETDSFCGTEPIIFKHNYIDVIKTSGAAAPGNPSYGYKDSMGFITIPFNSTINTSGVIKYNIQLNNLALCRYSTNAYL